MILVTGANGQLGTELRHLLDERNEEYVAVDVAEMDITDAEKVDEVFAEVKPTLVYHCAAYTAVDAAEDEGKELDYAINVTGTENVAKAAEKHGATLHPCVLYDHTLSVDLVYHQLPTLDRLVFHHQKRSQLKYKQALHHVFQQP